MNIALSDRDYTFGFFDSAYTFPEVSVTKKRPVTCYEIELYLENGGVTYVDDVPYQIKHGHVLCVKPGTVRYSELPLKTNYVKISTAARSLRETLEGLEPYFSVADIDYGNNLVQSMLRAREHGDGLLQHAGLLALLSWAREESDRAVRLRDIHRQKSREAIGRAMEYMEDNFRGKCTLEEVAAYVHLSPVYFHGIFHKAVGKTPYEYLTRLRVEEAKRLLLTGSMSMADISEVCGFSSQSYFNHSFKRRVGTTPSEYRRGILAGYFSENGIFNDERNKKENSK